jgi:hypothetical protein
LLRHRGPTTLRATVNAQPGEKRWVVHLLHYIPERRGQDFDVIEDVIPLYDLEVSLKTRQSVQGVTCVPQQEKLSFQQQGGRVKFVLPQLIGYQIVVLNLGN